jgi:hypothetical protein
MKTPRVGKRVKRNGIPRAATFTQSGWFSIIRGELQQ